MQLARSFQLPTMAHVYPSRSPNAATKTTLPILPLHKVLVVNLGSGSFFVLVGKFDLGAQHKL